MSKLALNTMAQLLDGLKIYNKTAVTCTFHHNGHCTRYEKSLVMQNSLPPCP